MYPERNTAPMSGEPFLATIHNRLCEARNEVSRLVDRCAEAGFYGPPESTGKEPREVDNTPRANIVDEMDRLQHNISILTHQLERLA